MSPPDASGKAIANLATEVHTRVLNQDGVLGAEFKRLVLVPRREPGK